jgi:16S rRNA processing protein RimM
LNGKTDFLIIGRIVSPFGIRGEVKVIPITDHAERFEGIEAVYVNQRGSYEKMDVEAARVVKKAVLLKLAQVADRDAAERLRDCMIYIDREHAAPLDGESHYYYDLLGCSVVTTEGDTLGTVTDIQNAGSCDVYCVKTEKNSDVELLIPAVRDVVKDINIRKKEIHIQVIDGLL